MKKLLYINFTICAIMLALTFIFFSVGAIHLSTLISGIVRAATGMFISIIGIKSYEE